MDEIAVIGGGPAGLRVMQVLARAGKSPTLFDQKRSVGRKFLIAGKKGLNLTNAAEQEAFLASYSGGEGFSPSRWAEIIKAFNNEALREWARELGQETFISSGKKVFPSSMKAAPLLRALVGEIRQNGGTFLLNHSLTGMQVIPGGFQLCFSTPEGEKKRAFKQVVLALGGGSWKKTGSDGKWVTLLKQRGVRVSSLRSANCGWEVNWPSSFLVEHEGSPLKNMRCTVGEECVEGELVITHYGLEGGPLYKHGSALRQMEAPKLFIDGKPTFNEQELFRKAESVRTRAPEELMNRWKLSAVMLGLLQWHHEDIFQKKRVEEQDLRALSQTIKNLEIPLVKPRPIEEAISSAGGVQWSEVDESLMVKALPGLYLCGEMLDWEAPTGGFLLQGCFSTGTWVAEQLLQKFR